MKPQSLYKKLSKISELTRQIEEVARPLYKEHGDLTAEVLAELFVRKQAQIVAAPLVVKLKGRRWRITPNFMKNGVLVNTIGKWQGIHAFTISEVEDSES